MWYSRPNYKSIENETINKISDTGTNLFFNNKVDDNLKKVFVDIFIGIILYIIDFLKS
jgi:hypothetical protein